MAGRYRPPRRSKTYYRKWVLDNFIYKERPRGLGKHRLPRLLPRSPWRRPPGAPGTTVRALVMLAGAVMLFACVLMCLSLTSLLFP